MQAVKEANLTSVSAAPQRDKFPAKFVFDVLDEAGVCYALLRGYDELFEKHDYLEIDLLVRAKDVAVLKSRLLPFGFRELPAWGHAPHRFFVAYSARLGGWLKLDVVTELCYGQPIRKYSVDLVETCLQNRVREDVNVLAPEFELLTTVLHCLLDKGRFSVKHRERLGVLARQVRGNRSAAVVLDALLERHISLTLRWSFIQKCVQSQEWNKLMAVSTRLESSLKQRNKLRAPWRTLTATVGRKLRFLLLTFRHQGVSVVLLAPDGAGKSTLAQSLVRDKILKAKLIYMGTNVAATTVGLPFTAALARATKKRRQLKKEKTVLGLVLRCLNLINKIAEHWYRCLVARYHLVRGKIVVFDRFVYDSWIQKRSKTWWKKFRAFLFNAPCPVPDLVFFLDAPGDVLYARKGEHSPQWIDEQRAKYHALTRILPQMHMIDASQSADNVRKEVTRLIWIRYGKAGSQSVNGSCS